MGKKALIVWGGWDGHQPKEVGEVFRKILVAEGFEVEVSNTLDALNDAAKVATFDLFVPAWTMGKISGEQMKSIGTAIENGTGIAGCHGGMCDAFREDCWWQFITGGQFVGHPGNDGTKYTVHIKNKRSPITKGIEDFEVASEQYYMHVDPAIKVLATTRFPVADGAHAVNGTVDMPVVWTKLWGKGKVFYNSLGHHADILEIPAVHEIMRRGFLWASR